MDSVTSVLAYFDPSAGSLLLQALVGGFGGLVVLGRYTWMQITNSRRARSTTSKPTSARPSNQA
ncbi:MAG: hypothetical protein DWH84_04955 [Planctomycetota bacterium]|nr:hypothetical protein [Planctomycetales bacterium]RLS44157.1 MAG: hypothetical protein DWH84_04955 [Planctomycetota bacterium]